MNTTRVAAVEARAMLRLRAVSAFVVALFAVFALVGCGASRPPTPEPVLVAAPALPARPSFEFKRTQDKQDNEERKDRVALQGELVPGSIAVAQSAVAGKSADLSAKLGRLLSSSPAPHTAQQAALPAAAHGGPRASNQRVEIEAQFAINVADAERAANDVRTLARQHGGEISKDQRTRSASSRVELVIRVPAEQYDAFAAALERVGEVQTRHVKEADVELEERDLATIVTNLEAALARYRALMAKATTVAEALIAEREIERTTTDLERVKVRLAWLRDRVARATVAIALQSSSTGPTPGAPWDPPQFAVAARGHFTFDLQSAGSDAYLGGGLTARFPSAGHYARGLALDVDLLKACCGSTPNRTNVGYVVSGGWDMYPESAQAHRRPWLVPYAGVRGGYANMRDRGDFAAGAVFGLDVLRTKALLIDVHARLWIMVGNGDGPHASAQPNVGVHVGF